MLNTGLEDFHSAKEKLKEEADEELSEVFGGEGVEELQFRSKWYVAGLWPFRRISFECPGCSRWLSVGSNHSGRNGFCPSCDLTVAAPDTALDLPPTLVSRSEKIPTVQARELPAKHEGNAPGDSSAPDYRGRSNHLSDLPRTPPVLGEESAWGIHEDRSLVPMRVVTHFQAFAPWAGIAALLVAAVAVGRMFMGMTDDPNAAEIPSIHPPVSKPKVPLGSELWVVLDSLSTATSPEELSTLVRQPAETLPKMQTYYSSHPEVSLPHHFERATPGVKLYSLDGVRFARFEGRCDGRPVKFSFEGTKYGWRLDWESMVGYSDQPWADYLDSRPEGEHQFRLLARISSDDLLEFDRKRFVCFHLTDHLESGHGFALVGRYSTTAVKLEKFLKLHSSGGSPRTWITPILKPLEGSDELFEMTDLISGSWLIP